VLVTNTTHEHAKGEFNMSKRPDDQWSRREFLTTVAAAGTGALLGAPSDALAAEASAETKRIRIPQIPSTCRSPEWVAEELLRAEGFTDAQYIPVQGSQGVEQASPLVKRTLPGTSQRR
jgi:hypothetical protein